MTNPATPIFPTTRSGSRRPVRWLNQPSRKGKAEPSRSLEHVLARAQASTSPDQYGTPSVPVESEASSLLVILHYLLKNNTTFMWGYEAGPNTSRRVVAAHSSCGKSDSHALHPREVGG